MIFAAKIWFVIALAASQQNHPCDSDIYCYGDLLRTVQLAKIFPDSKTFVDMKMRQNRTATLKNFAEFLAETGENPSASEVKKFVSDNFEEGDELVKWEPDDYNPKPKFLEKILDGEVKTLAEHLVSLWPVLARKVKEEVVRDSSKYSFLPVPNGFVVPGGRFREYYYWDSYWIIKGLLISEMTETARGMIDNFVHVVKVNGFVPNGGRIYYKDRSQPPLLAKMALEYYKHTGDKNWLTNNVVYFEKELQFWLDHKTVQFEKNGTTYTMAHYSASSTGPRPESYSEDFHTVQTLNDSEKQDQLYTELKSAAESGWDFSSRWIFDETGGNVANLSHIETSRVVPVDLNSFLCEAFKIVSDFFAEIGDHTRSEHWAKLANRWQKAIQEVLWNQEDGVWYDYDTKLSKPRRYFYVSNIAPLWCGCHDHNQQTADSVVTYLARTNAVNTAGGVATSLFQTGEQWDSPNAWPPLQAILVQGLEVAGSKLARVLAKSLAKKWVHANLAGFNSTGVMFEKYDAIQVGKHGGGGEYDVQSGFGWTNGVVLEFIRKYYLANGNDY